MRLTSRIWTPWLNSTTSPRFTHWRRDSGGDGTAAPVTSPAAGVSAATAGTSARSDEIPFTSRGMRATTNTIPTRANIPMVTARNGPSRVAAACHTSAVRNRNVTNRSSSGMARTNRLKTSPTWRTSRPHRPPGHRQQPVAGGGVDQPEEDEVADERVERGQPLPAGEQGQDGRHQDEHGQLGRAHPVGTGQQRPVAQGVGHGPHAEQGGEAAARHQDVHPPRPVRVQGQGQLQQQDEGERRAGCG